MKKEYYKIVSRDLRSIWTSWRKTQIDQVREKFDIQYKINKFVKPKVKESFLMVFDNWWDAKYFIKTNNLGGRGYRIFKADIKDATKHGIFCWDNPGLLKMETLLKLFKFKKWHKRYKYLCGKPPIGTVFVKQVKLLEEITC